MTTPTADIASGGPAELSGPAGPMHDASDPGTSADIVDTRGARRRALLVHGIQFAIVALFLAIWQYVGSTSKTQELTVSTPTKVADWAIGWAQGDNAHGWPDLQVTLHEAAVGGFYGVVIGIGLAVALSAVTWLRMVTGAFLAILNALPKIALAPLFILIFGSNLDSKVYFVASAIFFITFYNVFGGIRSIDPKYLGNARALGASRLWLVREVYAPAIVGWLMTGLRLTAAWALSGAVVVEYLASSEGMGWIVAQGQRTLRPEQVIAGILIIAAVAVIADRLIVRVERRFSAWRLS